ncbi:helix-turn-helix domain-containing protein [Enterococcus faecalis]|uniref:helix-turn-helix domain-containing protein n=1 Tax=Enterococcus faecalis TaxID=1351 RepID=UPI003984D5D7
MTHLNVVSDIGINLRRERKSKKLSIEELSKKSGVSGITISNIENKKSNPTVSVLWKLSEALGVPLTKLFGKLSDSPVKVSKLNQSPYMTDYKGNWIVEPIFYQDNLEVYRVIMMPNSRYSIEKQHENSLEILTVMSGKINVLIDDSKYSLQDFETISFSASKKHTYINEGTSKIYLNVIVKYQ